MDKFAFVVPHVLHLTNEAGWHSDTPDRKRATKFFVTRWHFVLERSPAQGATMRGELLGAYRSPQGSEMTVNDKISRAVTTVNLERTITTSLQESQQIVELTTALRAEVGGGGAKTAADQKSRLQNLLKSSISETTFTERVTTDQSTNEWSVEFKIPAEQTLEYQVVAAYKMRRCRLYLSHVDYLSIEYTKSLLGFRRKRRKYPVASGARKNSRANVISVGVPVADIEMRERVPKSVCVIRADEAHLYEEVPDPAEIVTSAPADRQSKSHLPGLWSDQPSLYQVAEAAFPITWIKRTNAGWTREELLAIEADESKEVDAKFRFRQ